MGMVVNQYDVFLIDLDPTKGSEIKKMRPCLVISPNEMNKFIETIIIAPMTTKSHNYPTRIELVFQRKRGWIVLDQIRTVDKIRLKKRLGKIGKSEIQQVKNILQEMLVD